ncbi:MAG: polyprenyl synthetase family protein [Clostridia bacterium]|nr:polyprenyl synthetase family protein [Clostridia bacterium]
MAPFVPIPHLLRVEERLHQAVDCPSPEVHEVLTFHLSGGKRLRPALVFLSAGFGPYDPEQVIDVAASLELIHLASLIHDDLIDGASFRRSKPALHKAFGNLPAVLAGDYLFAAAFSLLSRAKKSVISTVTSAIQSVCEGEITEQRKRCASEAEYYHLISKKTGALMAAACESGGLLCGISKPKLQRLKLFGLHLGRAFQMVDDILDLTGENSALGKPVLRDLAQEIVTLPILYFMDISPLGRELWNQLTSGGITEETGRRWVEQIKEAGCLQRAVRAAETEIELALGQLRLLPPEPARQELAQLARQILMPVSHLLNDPRPAEEGAQAGQVTSLGAGSTKDPFSHPLEAAFLRFRVGEIQCQQTVDNRPVEAGIGQEADTVSGLSNQE